LEEGRRRVRKDFQGPPITNLNLLNIFLLKGTQELIEIHNKWKQKTHVMRWYYEEDSPPIIKTSFIDDFFRPKF